VVLSAETFAVALLSSNAGSVGLWPGEQAVASGRARREARARV
jgi:hypothetical protein